MERGNEGDDYGDVAGSRECRRQSRIKRYSDDCFVPAGSCAGGERAKLREQRESGRDRLREKVKSLIIVFLARLPVSSVG